MGQPLRLVTSERKYHYIASCKYARSFTTRRLRYRFSANRSQVLGYCYSRAKYVWSRIMNNLENGQQNAVRRMPKARHGRRTLKAFTLRQECLGACLSETVQLYNLCVCFAIQLSKNLYRLFCLGCCFCLCFNCIIDLSEKIPSFGNVCFVFREFHSIFRVGLSVQFVI